MCSFDGSPRAIYFNPVLKLIIDLKELMFLMAARIKIYMRRRATVDTEIEGYLR